MLQFIYNNIRVELTHLNVTFNELNPWMQEDLTSEYSFPFDMAVKDWIKISDYGNYNASNVQRMFVGKLYRDGDLTDATLKIKEQKGHYVSGIIYSGLNVLSALDVKLADLPLENFNVFNLKQHAITVIGQNYPQVDYNFPMVHTDKYDPESTEFHNFEKVINNYGAGQFIENELVTDTNIDNIRNIMQPLPYLMYVIRKGFEQAGFQLQGDILNDPDLKKALIFRDGSYYDSLTKEAIPLRVNVAEHIQILMENNIEHSFYLKEITIPKKGDYSIFGYIYSIIYYSIGGFPCSSLQINIQRESGGVFTTLYTKIINPESGRDVDVTLRKNYNIDLTVALEQGDRIIFTKLEPKRDQVPSITPDYPEAAALDITPIRFRKPDGTPLISLQDINAIYLAKVVPDMSLLDVLNILRKWKNYGLTFFQNVVTMDSIQPKLNRGEAVNLSDYDIEEPLRTFSDEQSFEIAFTDGKSNEAYIYESVFIDGTGSTTSNYRKKEDTQLISIDALPYPVVSRSGITTSFAFDDESSKLRLVFYRAMPEDGSPVCFDNPNMLIPAIYKNCYTQWLNFRINSVAYTWDFIISVERLRQIKMQSLIFAYNNYHVLTEIEKERLDGFNWRVTAKSESLQ